MRYELCESGYINKVFFGCHSGTCTLYEGIIPDGYETLEEWADNANIRAYKIVDGNLVFDEEEDARLQEEYKKDGKTIFEGTLKGGESTTLSNVKRFLDIYYRIDFWDEDGCGKYTIDTELDRPTFGSDVLAAFDVDNGIEYYISESRYDKDTKTLTHTRTGFFNVSSGTYTSRNGYNDYYVYRIDTYE